MATGGIDTSVLKNAISTAQDDVVNAIETIKNAGDKGAGILDMFEVQNKMYRLSQVSEMSTSVVSAQNTSMMSMSRNTKG